VDVSVSGPAGATRISLGGISLSTLSILGVEPVIGRWYRLDEATVEGDTAETLVISYGLWQSHFGGDADVVGKTVPGWDAAWGRTVIGVMPPDFWVHPAMADVDGWFAFNVARIPGARPQTLARLAPGVDYAAAEAELDTIAKRVEATLPGGADAAEWNVRLEPLHDVVTEDYKAADTAQRGALQRDMDAVQTSLPHRQTLQFLLNEYCVRPRTHGKCGAETPTGRKFMQKSKARSVAVFKLTAAGLAFALQAGCG